MSEDAPAAVDHRAWGFGRHVWNLRKARGLTQEALAERAQLSADTIRRLEHDSFSPSLVTVRKLAGGLGLRVSTLFRSMDAGDPRRPELDALIGLLRENPGLPVGGLLALVSEMVEGATVGPEEGESERDQSG